MNILQHIQSCAQTLSVMGIYNIELISLYRIHHSFIEYSVALAQKDAVSAFALTETRRPQCELYMTQAKQ